MFPRLALSSWGENEYSLIIGISAMIGLLGMAELGIPSAVQNKVILNKNDSSEDYDRSIINTGAIFHFTFIFLGLLILFYINYDSLNWDYFYNYIAIFLYFLIGVLITYINVHLSCAGKYNKTLKIALFIKFMETASLVIIPIFDSSPSIFYLLLSLIKIFAAIFLYYNLSNKNDLIKLNLIRSSIDLYKLRLSLIGFSLFPVGFIFRNQFYILMAATVLSSRDLIIYTSTRTVVNLIYQFMGVLNNSYQIYLTELISTNQFKKIYAEVKGVCKKLIYSVSIASLLLLFNSDTIFELWLGDNYTPNKLFMIILLCDVTLHTIWGFGTMILISANRPTKLSISFIISNLVGLLILKLFLLKYGLYGLAFSLLISNIFMLIISYFLVTNFMKYNNNNKL